MRAKLQSAAGPGPCRASPDESAAKTVPPGSNTAAAIILLTDGQTTTGPDPIEAARMAADHGVRVYTVGIGTANGEIIGFEGWSMRVRLDEEALKTIADITRGEYFYASNAARAQDGLPEPQHAGSRWRRGRRRSPRCWPLPRPSRRSWRRFCPCCGSIAFSDTPGIRAMQVGDSVFLITGGASGLGAGTARMVVGNGGKAVLADLKEAEGKALAAELGGAARFVRTDVTDEASAKAAVAATLAAFGALHGPDQLRRHRPR